MVQCQETKKDNGLGETVLESFYYQNRLLSRSDSIVFRNGEQLVPRYGNTDTELSCYFIYYFPVILI